MKNIIKRTILYLLLVTTASIITCPHDSSSVIEITTSDQLQDLLSKNQGPCAILLYMQNCSYCEKLKPIFENLACNDQFTPITFYVINGPQTQAPKIIKKTINQTIEGYPTMFFFNQGKLVTTQVGGASQNNLIKKLNQLLR